MLHLCYHDIADRMSRSTAPGSAVGQLLIFLYRMRPEASKHQHSAENQRATQHLPDESACPLRVLKSHPKAVNANDETAPGDRSRPPEFLREVV
jgi:hypothetical protein